MNWQALILLIATAFATNVFYKGRNFRKVTWAYTLLLSSWFWCGSIFLFSIGSLYQYTKNSYFGLFILISLAWFLWPYIIRKFRKFPTKYFEREPSRFLVRFDPKITVIKYSEIIFQQVTFLFLFFAVLPAFAFPQKIGIATIIIGIAHLFNFFTMPAKWAAFYFIASIPIGPVFGFLILGGNIFLTVSLHILFYIMCNSYYWFRKE